MFIKVQVCSGTSTEIQSGLDFMGTIMGITGILSNFRFIPGRKVGKKIPESSR